MKHMQHIRITNPSKNEIFMFYTKDKTKQFETEFSRFATESDYIVQRSVIDPKDTAN